MCSIDGYSNQPITTSVCNSFNNSFLMDINIYNYKFSPHCEFPNLVFIIFGFENLPSHSSLIIDSSFFYFYYLNICLYFLLHFYLILGRHYIRQGVSVVSALLTGQYRSTTLERFHPSVSYERPHLFHVYQCWPVISFISLPTNNGEIQCQIQI